jgi:Peptidase inhibitor family I36
LLTRSRHINVRPRPEEEISNMNRIAPTIRGGLRALSLLLGASAIIGGAASGQAIASALDPAPSPKTTSAAAKRSCPVGSVCRAARECPRGRICLWSADHFLGTKLVVRPVPSGKCRKIGDVDGAWRSVYNASREFARLWQFTHDKPGPFGLPNITKCGGGSSDTNSNNLVAPHTARRAVSFGGGAEGLGGR